MAVKLQKGAFKRVSSVILGFVFFVLGLLLVNRALVVANNHKISTETYLTDGMCGWVAILGGLIIIADLLYIEFKSKK
jgi:hypothetical protein